VFDPVSVPLLREEVCAKLRDAILSGTLAPGRSLDIDQLAGQLELSRTPVREALARLRDEGLVEVKPRSGTRVAPLRLDDARQALAVITTMHELAVRIATPRLEPRHLNSLETAAERFATAVERSDGESAIAADDDFHGVFVDVAGNRPLRATVARYMPLLRRAERLRFGTLPGRRSVAAHRQILTAAKRGDVDAAVEATRANWGSLANQMGVP
jgi:DNA-binding GntR family transcriptional regulator